jgi:NADP-dependent 3-hydroxy acid dehydrogenase YdfG
MTENIAEKVVIITGASSGMGAAAARGATHATAKPELMAKTASS